MFIFTIFPYATGFLRTVHFLKWRCFKTLSFNVFRKCFLVSTGHHFAHLEKEMKSFLRTLKLVTYGEAYENLRVETVSAFRYIKHAVVSCVPEGDAINRVCSIARHCGVITPVSLAGIFNLTSLC